MVVGDLGMNITKAQLKEIIKEELDLVLERTDVRSQRELIGPALGQFTADELEQARKAAMAKQGKEEREILAMANRTSEEEHLEDVKAHLKQKGILGVERDEAIKNMTKSGKNNKGIPIPILFDAEVYTDLADKKAAKDAKTAATATDDAAITPSVFLKGRVIPFLQKNADKYWRQSGAPSKESYLKDLERFKNMNRVELVQMQGKFEEFLGKKLFNQVFNNKRGVMQKLANFFSKGGTYSQ